MSLSHSPWLTVAEVAAYARVSRTAVYDAVRRHDLPASRAFGPIRISRKDLEEWMSSRAA